MTKRATEITDDTPLRLKEAAEIAFPNGGMTVHGLRRENKRGRLDISRIANKDYTTLGNIRRMIELCHVKPNHQDSGNARSAATQTATSPMLPDGFSSMQVAKSALESNLTTFKVRSER
jgi:hypothetical protein